MDWIGGRDTGASSVAIWSHMMGARSSGSFPYDPSDFGRCYRLLTLAPEWRARIGEMAKYSKTWARLAARWDELTALFEAETGAGGLATADVYGGAPRTYAAMLECRK